MKKIIATTLTFLYVACGYASETVQSVVDITPDKPLMQFPKPPTEIKATDIISTPSTIQADRSEPVAKRPLALKSKNVSKKVLISKAQKPFEQLTQEEQIKALKHKIDKLRKRSHEIRAKLRSVKEEVANLKQQMIDLKTHEVSEPEILEDIEEMNETQGE